MGLEGSLTLPNARFFVMSETNLERLAKALKPYHRSLRGAAAGLPFH